jgi:hypothetical protein
VSLRQLTRSLRTMKGIAFGYTGPGPAPVSALVSILKARALEHGGSKFQVPGIIERDLSAELKREDWVAFDGSKARVIKSSKGIPMRTCGCHENAARVALSRGWECWTGLALSEDGIWRVHSWARVPSTGTVIETTTGRVKYLGVKLSVEDTEDLL